MGLSIPLMQLLQGSHVYFKVTFSRLQSPKSKRLQTRGPETVSSTTEIIETWRTGGGGRQVLSTMWCQEPKRPVQDTGQWLNGTEHKDTL